MMSLLRDPDLSADLNVLQAHAAAADAASRLQPEQIAIIRRRGWPLLLAPASLGGQECPLPQALALEEAVAGADGSCGWAVTLVAGAGWFGGFLEPDVAARVFATPEACLAGSGAPTGVAERDGDGWRLHGLWQHASGAPLARHFTLRARLQQGGLPLLDAAGQPRTLAFVLPAEQVEQQPDSWHSIGLRASGSHAFAVHDVRVEQAQGFELAPGSARLPGALYRFPFGALALATLAACMRGMAWRFVTMAEPLARRPRPHLGHPSAAAIARWEDARQRLQAAGDDFDAALAPLWQAALAGHLPAVAHNEAFTERAHALAAISLGVSDALYPTCGLHAADPRSALNRVWRDLHTASQHALWVR